MTSSRAENKREVGDEIRADVICDWQMFWERTEGQKEERPWLGQDRERAKEGGRWPTVFCDFFVGPGLLRLVRKKGWSVLPFLCDAGYGYTYTYTLSYTLSSKYDVHINMQEDMITMRQMAAGAMSEHAHHNGKCQAGKVQAFCPLSGRNWRLCALSSFLTRDRMADHEASSE